MIINNKNASILLAVTMSLSASLVLTACTKQKAVTPTTHVEPTVIQTLKQIEETTKPTESTPVETEDIALTSEDVKIDNPVENMDKLMQRKDFKKMSPQEVVDSVTNLNAKWQQEYNANKKEVTSPYFENFYTVYLKNGELVPVAEAKGKEDFVVIFSIVDKDSRFFLQSVRANGWDKVFKDKLVKIEMIVADWDNDIYQGHVNRGTSYIEAVSTVAPQKFLHVLHALSTKYYSPESIHKDINILSYSTIQYILKNDVGLTDDEIKLATDRLMYFGINNTHILPIMRQQFATEFAKKYNQAKGTYPFIANTKTNKFFAYEEGEYAKAAQNKDYETGGKILEKWVQTGEY